MNSILCCFVFLATLSCINCMQADQEIQEKCLKESKLTQQEIESPNAMKEPSEHSFCYLGCMAEYVGFWNHKTEESMELIGKLDDEAMKEKLKECLMKIQKTDRCQAGREIHACVKATGLFDS